MLFFFFKPVAKNENFHFFRRTIDVSSSWDSNCPTFAPFSFAMSSIYSTEPPTKGKVRA